MFFRFEVVNFLKKIFADSKLSSLNHIKYNKTLIVILHTDKPYLYIRTDYKFPVNGVVNY